MSLVVVFLSKSSSARMVKLAAAEPQGEWAEAASGGAAPSVEADAAAARLAARVRLMMVISGLTTMIAIAAVVGVIGYRFFHAGGGATLAVEGTVTLPKAARVVATAIAGDRIVVTLDLAGATEIRTFDVKTLKETGRIRFATEP
jgi:hypothetical protein